MNIYSFFLSILCFVCGCSRSCEHVDHLRNWMCPDGRLKVLCTTAFVAELVDAVGGEEVDAIVLVPFGGDPHSYKLVKGDSEKFARADVIFSSGLGLEQAGALSRYLKAASAVEVTQAIEEPIFHEGLPDPHAWLDVSVWAKGLDVIERVLAQKRADKKEFFERRANEKRETMHLLHEQIHELLEQIPERDRRLVSTHDAFYYFARGYLSAPGQQFSDRVSAPEGMASEGQISTRDVEQVVDYIREHEVRVVFSEYGVNTDSICKVIGVCREQGLDVRLAGEYLYSDVSEEKIDYAQMMQHNARAIVRAYMEGNGER